MTPGAVAPRWVVGIDAGGTFTDLVAFDAASGEVRRRKVPSTPARPADAVRAALGEADVGGSRRVVHGTTVATNAVLERRGGRVCLLTTAGFEDVAFIQRINRRYAFDLDWRKPQPLVRRRDIVAVRERVAADGRVLEPLSAAECERVAALVAELARSEAIDAIAICLLFSFANDVHEQQLAGALAERLPQLPVSLSSRVSPLWREYERVSTTLADAYVRPLMEGYLDELDRTVGGAEATLLVLKSNGGTAAPASVAPQPVTTLISGLAGGVVAGARCAALNGESRAITLDVGGTSTDVGLVRDGRVGHRNEFEIEWGLPVVTPVVDVHTVGAGGGSIGRVDSGGMLVVGPQSAGAVPGPAAYGRGGQAATVTDANLVLGRLDAARFLGGRMRLDLPAAQQALADLGEQTGLTMREAALAVVAIGCENIANAIRLITIERGIDPREFALVAFGGAGPLYACAVAEALGIERIAIPPHPGLCSALGAAIAPLRVDRVWTLARRSDNVDEGELRRQLAAAEVDARAELERDGASGAIVVERTIACRYYLQNYEQEVALDDPGAGCVERVAGAFHAVHEGFYGYAFAEEAVELVHCRVTASAAAQAHGGAPTAGVAAERRGVRAVTDPAGAERETAIVARGRLAAALAGPAIVEEEDSTTYVAPGWTAHDGAEGTLVLVREAAA